MKRNALQCGIKRYYDVQKSIRNSYVFELEQDVEPTF
jgi:hypothetical protein